MGVARWMFIHHKPKCIRESNAHARSGGQRVPLVAMSECKMKNAKGKMS
jgi:hypothetical protein